MSDSSVVAREPCPKCGSRDNLARYDDGHAYCFSVGCEYRERGDGETSHQRRPMNPKLLPIGEYKAIASRHLDETTCRKFDYSVGGLNGTIVQIATYKDDNGVPVAQKVRTKDKKFACYGDMSNAPLFGRHLWRSSGRRIFITEGEIDAMSISQVLQHKWPVVSIPNGSQSAKKALAANLEWLNAFEQVTLVFDMDEPGRKAVEDCTSLFPPGKLSVATLPLKDANEMLVAGRIEDLVNALWGAKEHRPDGIARISDIKASIFESIATDLTWADPRLNEVTYGRRYGEAVGFGAGTGVGKTTLLMGQIAHDLAAGHAVGLFAFEQPPSESVKLIAGHMAGKTFHIPDGSWTEEDLIKAVEELEKRDKLFMYDHFGACEWDVVKERIRYLNHAHGVRVFYVDHLTALAQAEDNERTGLERITAEISSLTQELKIWLGFVSHLSTPEGKPHEEGGRVMIRHFKGSRAIGFWAHEIYGIERNQQADDDEGRRTIFRILKHRKVGRSVGKTFALQYEESTGRLIPADDFDPMTADESDEAPF